jgi:hypothetical protein
VASAQQGRSLQSQSSDGDEFVAHITKSAVTLRQYHRCHTIVTQSPLFARL